MICSLHTVSPFIYDVRLYLTFHLVLNINISNDSDGHSCFHSFFLLQSLVLILDSFSDAAFFYPNTFYLNFAIFWTNFSVSFLHI